jgi:hypothetical protein
LIDVLSFGLKQNKNLSFEGKLSISVVQLRFGMFFGGKIYIAVPTLTDNTSNGYDKIATCTYTHFSVPIQRLQGTSAQFVSDTKKENSPSAICVKNIITILHKMI